MLRKSTIVLLHRNVFAAQQSTSLPYMKANLFITDSLLLQCFGAVSLITNNRMLPPSHVQIVNVVDKKKKR